MQSVSLFDLVTLEVIPGASGIHLECSAPEIPCDSRNLAWKAAERLAVFRLRLGAERRRHGGAAAGHSAAQGVEGRQAFLELCHGGAVCGLFQNVFQRLFFVTPVPYGVLRI